MLAPSTFRRSRLSWFRCSHCDAATYNAISRIILSREPPKVTVEYKCEYCDKLSTLRHPILMNLGLPFAIAACACPMLYKVLLLATSWSWLSTISAIGLIIAAGIAAELAISRLAKRFLRA